ncbi:MAG: hypothetical protein AAGM38_10230 [Pseudomonadota bacterium]
MTPLELFARIIGPLFELYFLYHTVFRRPLDPETDALPLGRLRGLARLRALKRGEQFLVSLHQEDGGVVGSQPARTPRAAFALIRRAFRKSGYARARFDVNSAGTVTLLPVASRVRWIRSHQLVGYMSVRIEPIR